MAMTHLPFELRSVLADMVRIVETLGEIDVRDLESGPASEAWEALRGPTGDTLQSAIDLLDQVIEVFDEAGPRGDVDPDEWGSGFDRGVDALVGQSTSTSDIADLAFMARFELRRKVEVIVGLELEPSSDVWELLPTFESARRRVRKSLTAVATVLCRDAGIEPVLSFASALSGSLETRRVYACLRRSIREDTPPVDDEVRIRLRGIGTQIAMLVGRPIYPDLRILDRVEVRRLQARILAWLRGDPASPAHLREGHRLWEDLVGFGRALTQVNRRHEILEHDAQLVELAHGMLCGESEETVVPDPLLERLMHLLGADDEIDALLDERSCDVTRWRPPLCRLHRAFGTVHAFS